jgi:hypothetical protein
MNILQFAVPLPRFKSYIPPSKVLSIAKEAEAATLARRRRGTTKKATNKPTTENVEEEGIGRIHTI